MGGSIYQHGVNHPQESRLWSSLGQTVPPRSTVRTEIAVLGVLVIPDSNSLLPVTPHETLMLRGGAKKE